MNKQLCAALLAGTMLTSTMVMAEPKDNRPEPVAAPVPIMAKQPAPTITATMTLGESNAIINGQPVKLAFTPYLNHGVTMVPLNILANYLNADLGYDANDQSVTISQQGKNKVTFVLGDAEITVNGARRKLPALTELIQDRSSVPLRVFAEVFGIEVRYADGVITLIRQAPEDPKGKPPETPTVEKISFFAFDGKLLPALDYSLIPKAYTGYAKDFLATYPEGQGDSLILAISQPGQEMMIQSIEARQDKIVVHVLPESRWSNAPEGTMGLVYYGPRRVVKLNSPLPNLPIEIDAYEVPTAPAVTNAQEVAFERYQGSDAFTYDQTAELGVVKKAITIDGQPKLLLVACLGEQRSGGYSIQVQWIENTANKLIVHAKSTAPTPGEFVILPITHPQDLVVIDNQYASWDMELVLNQLVPFTHFEGTYDLSLTDREQAGIYEKQIDGQTIFIVGAGAKPTTGYSLQVQWVEQVGSRLQVHAKVTSPAPGSINAQMVTYPSDAFTVEAQFANLLMDLVLH